MRLAEILGYQLSVSRCAVRRSLHRQFADSPLRTAALRLVRDQPDQALLSAGREARPT